MTGKHHANSFIERCRIAEQLATAAGIYDSELSRYLQVPQPTIWRLLHQHNGKPALLADIELAIEELYGVRFAAIEFLLGEQNRLTNSSAGGTVLIQSYEKAKEAMAVAHE